MKAFIVFFSFCDYVILYICSLCLNFFSPTCLKVKFRKKIIFIQTNSFIILTCLNPALLVLGFRKVGQRKDCICRHANVKNQFTTVNCLNQEISWKYSLPEALYDKNIGKKMKECVHTTRLPPLPVKVNRGITLERKKW